MFFQPVGAVSKRGIIAKRNGSYDADDDDEPGPLGRGPLGPL